MSCLKTICIRRSIYLVIELIKKDVIFCPGENGLRDNVIARFADFPIFRAITKFMAPFPAFIYQTKTAILVSNNNKPIYMCSQAGYFDLVTNKHTSVQKIISLFIYIHINNFHSFFICVS